MSKIIVVDDEKQITEQFSEFLKGIGHTPYPANTIDEALEIVDNFVEQSEEPDLFVLDHDLTNGDTAISLLKVLEQEESVYFRDRFIVVTGQAEDQVTESYSKYGSISHLIKPVHRQQFEHAVKHALYKIELSVLREDWELAYEVLEKEGVLDSLKSISSYNDKINSQYLTFKNLYEELLEKTKKSDAKELALAYERASNAINNTEGEFDLIKKYQNEKFKFTKSFIDDVKDVFKTNQILFLSLLNYLGRIQESPNAYRIKSLDPAAPGSYEYRVARDKRLYFKRLDGAIVFTRYGHKNNQIKIFHNLSSGLNSPIIEI